MAEILVKAVDAVHPDPDKDQRGSYKRGMPVVVMSDGHTWGTEETLPTFVILKVPGISVAKVRHYIFPDERPATASLIMPLVDWQAMLLANDYGRFLSKPVSLSEFMHNGEVHVELQGPMLQIHRRRQWHIQFNELPLTARNKLQTTGELTIKAGTYAGLYDYTWAQVKGFFLDHKTGLRETRDV